MTELLLITSDYPPRYGGISRYYSSLARNHDITILTNCTGEETDKVIRTQWLWPAWPRWLPLLWLVPYIKFKTKAKILAAGEILPIGTALLIIRLAFGWPYLVFVHGLDLQLAGRNSWKLFLRRKILQHALGVVANSNFTQNLAIKAGAKPNSTQVIYPAYINKPSSIEVQERLIKHYRLADQKIILTVARLVERKGIDWVLAALHNIEAQYNDLVYVVVGEGEYKNNLQVLAAKLRTRVIFTGAVEDEELLAWYQICQLFILTPIVDSVDVEGFGIVYLEAMAAGKPIIASKAGGVPEAVGEAGILISSQEELSRALVNLLQQKDVLKKWANTASRQLAKFSPAQQVENFSQYLKSLKI